MRKQKEGAPLSERDEEGEATKALREIYDLSGNDSIALMIRVKEIARQALGSATPPPQTDAVSAETGLAPCPFCGAQPSVDLYGLVIHPYSQGASCPLNHERMQDHVYLRSDWNRRVQGSGATCNQLEAALWAKVAEWRKSADEPWDSGYVNTWLGCADEIESLISSPSSQPQATEEKPKSEPAAPTAQEQPKEFQHNPAHKCGTCSKCGEEMVWNVPRMGPNGGFIHKATGKFVCNAASLRDRGE